MRMMIRVTVPVEQGNATVKDGSLGAIIQAFMAEHKPEAAYFAAEGGNRTAYFVVGISDTSNIPPMAEPFFMGLNAKVEFIPVMNAEELGKGLSRLKSAG